MMPPRPTDVVHHWLQAALRPGDHAIDATTGNGHDTLFLAQIVGSGGRVDAYDIQKTALEATHARLMEHHCHEHVTLHHMSHARMADHAEPGTVTAVIFNLGYLPGHDHQTTTRTPETLLAVKIATKLLRPGGVLAIVCYPGHAEGNYEAQAVENLLISLTTDGWKIAKYQLLGTMRPAPFALIACPREIQARNTMAGS